MSSISDDLSFACLWPIPWTWQNILFANKIIILMDRWEQDLILSPHLIWLSKPVERWQIKNSLILTLLPGKWRHSVSQKSVQLSAFHVRDLLNLILFTFCFVVNFFFPVSGSNQRVLEVFLTLTDQFIALYPQGCLWIPQRASAAGVVRDRS